MTRRTAPLALAAAVMIGCAGAGEAPGAPERAANVLQVENQNWLDAKVYIVKASTRHRLGTVATNGSRRFAIPDHMISPGGQLRLLVDLIGSPERYVTDAISTAPGAVIEFRVQNHLALSSYMVLRR